MLILKNKRFIIIIVLIVIIAAAAGILFSGILTLPTQASLAKAKAVQSYDILEFQFQIEKEILADYAEASYTAEKPYIVQNPYQVNPLSALILFETETPLQATVSVKGKDSYTTFSFTEPEPKTHHEIAVLGLYPASSNQVSLTLADAADKVQVFEHLLISEALPFDFPNLDIQVTKPEKMEPGLFLMIPCFDTSYTYLLDANGDVRGYFTNRYFAHGTAVRVLANGRLLATGDVTKLMPYNMYTLWEFNLLGKVFHEYEIPNAVHHDVVELSNGDFLAVSNNAGMTTEYHTREDVIIYIDRQTGKVVKEYNLREILDDRREPYNHFDPGIINAPNRDWAHTNAAVMDEASNSIIASSPIQSVVVKFNADTLAIDWILSSPEGWEGDFSRFQQYLLKPIGETFEWQWGQHASMLLPDSDHNPETQDLLLFDNGQSRSYAEETSVPPEKNYSRGVIFRINEKERTVEQLWQYGKERGSEGYSTFLGDVNLLPQTGNISIAFGGMLRSNGVPVDNIVQGVLGQQQIQSRVTEVKKDGEVVFDVSVTPNHSSTAETYQVTKLDLYHPSIQYSLGDIQGERKGAIQSAKQTDYKAPSFYIPRFSFNFKQIYKKSGYLIMEGDYTYQGKYHMLGKMMFILRSREQEYIYASNSGLNGRFFIRIDLSQLEPGEYAIYAIGGVTEGMDAMGKIMPGYNSTGYKVIVQ